MASLGDTALGADDSGAAGSTLANSTTFSVVAGQLLVVPFKFEGSGTPALTASDTPQALTWGIASALRVHANNDLQSGILWAIAGSTGDIVVTASIAPASWPYRGLRAYAFTPVGSWSYDTEVSATGTSGAPSTGAATAAGAGVAVMAIGAYSSVTLTPGNSFVVPTDFNISSSLCTAYRFLSAGGSITGSGTFSSVAWTANLAVFTDSGGAGGGEQPAVKRFGTPFAATSRAGAWRERLSGLVVPDRRIRYA